MSKRTFVGLTGVVVMALATAACTASPGSGTTTPPTTPAVTATATATGAPVTLEPTPACAETASWATETPPKPVYAGLAATINDVRTGRHDCFDQVTISMSKIAPVGYDIKYVAAVIADASGDPVPVAGGAVLQVIVFAWDYCYPINYPTPAPTTKPCWKANTVLSGPVGQAVQQVKHAGTHEGQTTFAVGVTSKLKFAVSIWNDKAAGVTRIILFVAHPAGK